MLKTPNVPFLIFCALTSATTSAPAQASLAVSGYRLAPFATLPGTPGLDGVAVGKGGSIGDAVYVASNGKIYSVPRDGGTPVQVATGLGQHLYLESSIGGSLFTVNSGTGNLREHTLTGPSLTVTRSFAGISQSEGMQWTAAGTNGRLLVSNYSGSSGQAIYSLDLDQPHPTIQLVQSVSTTSYGPLELDTAPWSTFGSDVFFVSQAGQVHRLANGQQQLFVSLPGVCESIAFPPAGSLFGDYLYAFLSNGSIYRIAPGGQMHLFATGFLNYYASNAIAFSPDGRNMFVAPDREATLYQITPSTIATCMYRAGMGINPVLHGCSSLPVLGSTWTTHVATEPGTNLTLLGIAFAPGSLLLLDGEVLISNSPPPAVLVGLGSHSISLPNDASYVGLQLFTQGFRFDTSSLLMSNAIEAGVGW